MPKRNWRRDSTNSLIAAACILLVIFGVSAGLALWQHKLGRDQTRAYHSEQYTQQPSGICIKLPPLVAFCPQEQGGPRAEAQRDDDDLKAQQEMADWAFGVVFISAIGFFLSLIGVVLIYATFSATRTQLAVARKANKLAKQAAVDSAAQVRAYVSVSSIRGAVDPTRRRIKIEAYIKNTGQTSARKIDYSTGLVFVDQNGRRVHSAEGSELSDPIDLVTDEPRLIFNHEVELDGGRFTDLQRRYGSILFEGRISYETVFDRRPRWTPGTHFCFEVRWENPRTTTELTFVRAREGNRAT